MHNKEINTLEAKKAMVSKSRDGIIWVNFNAIKVHEKSQPAVYWSLFQSSLNSFPTATMDLLGWEPLREAAEKEDGTSIAGTLYGTIPLWGKNGLKPFSLLGSFWLSLEAITMKRRVAGQGSLRKFQVQEPLTFRSDLYFVKEGVGRCEASNRQSLEAPTDSCKSVGGFPFFWCVFFGLNDGAAIPPEGACDGRTTVARGSASGWFWCHFVLSV